MMADLLLLSTYVYKYNHTDLGGMVAELYIMYASYLPQQDYNNILVHTIV